jgi:hypothetical protein
MSDSSFYDSNSKRLEEDRIGILDFPDYDANLDWLQKFKRDPSAVIRAVNDWWSIATTLMDGARQYEVLEIPRGFVGLTNLLALLCDREVTSIDAMPLKDFYDAVYAREGELFDLVSSSAFQSPEKMESTLRKAMVVKDRLEKLAEAKEQEYRRKEEKRQSQENEPPDEQVVQDVREIIHKYPNATRKTIQKKLKGLRGRGIGNDLLRRVLDILRESGEYRVSKKNSPRR